MHLGKAYLAPYEERGWGALCTCSARASVLNASFSRGPEGHTGGATDPKLAGLTHTVSNLKSIGGAICVGCRLHAPGAENLFDEGSSGLWKL